MNSKKAQTNVIKEAHTTMDIDFVITWVTVSYTHLTLPTIA